MTNLKSRKFCSRPVLTPIGQTSMGGQLLWRRRGQQITRPRSRRSSIEAGANPRLKDVWGQTAEDIAADERKYRTELHQKWLQEDVEVKAQAQADEEFLSGCTASLLSDRHYSKVAVGIIDNFFTRHVTHRNGSLLDQMTHGAIVGGIVGRYFNGPIFLADAGGNIFNERLDGGNIVQAIRSIISFAAANPDTAIVINMSWGTSERSSHLASLFDTLSNCGLVFVAAAGNDGKASCSFPAGYPGVIGVGSVGRGTDSRADYSNYGDCVQVAVGEDVVPLDLVLPPGHSSAEYDPGEIMQRMRLAGTSFAAAHVSGLIAQMIADNPAHSLAALVERLPSHDKASGFDHPVKFLRGGAQSK